MKVFAQLTDLHIDDFLAKKYRVDTRKNVEAALEAIGAKGIRDLVLTGDLGDASALPWLFAAIGDRGMRSSVVLGNHDSAAAARVHDGVAERMRNDGLYYAEDIEGTRCLFLDSSSATIGRGQFAWLREQAKATKAKNLAVFVHHPVLDCGDSLMDRRYPLTNRADVAEFLGGLDADVWIFCGHYHTAHERRAGRISQFVTPSLFVQFKSHAASFQVESRDIAYRRIELDAGNVRTELVAVG